MLYKINWPSQYKEPPRPVATLISKDGFVVDGSASVIRYVGHPVGPVLSSLTVSGCTWAAVSARCRAPRRQC